MFTIKYKIQDQLENLKNITCKEFDEEYGNINGFFSIEIASIFTEGLYIDDYPFEEGKELLGMWFYYILRMKKALIEHNYFKEQEPDGIIRSIKMDRKNEKVFITIYENISKQGLRTEEQIKLEPSNIEISFNEVIYEIDKNINHFIAEIRKINPEILKSKAFRFLT